MNPDAPAAKFLSSIPQDASFGIALLALGTKIFLLIGLSFFVIFGIVMVRQITMMAKSVETSLTPFLHIAGVAYLATAALIWVFAFSVL